MPLSVVLMNLLQVFLWGFAAFYGWKIRDRLWSVAFAVFSFGSLLYVGAYFLADAFQDIAVWRVVVEAVITLIAIAFYRLYRSDYKTIRKNTS